MWFPECGVVRGRTKNSVFDGEYGQGLSSPAPPPPPPGKHFDPHGETAKRCVIPRMQRRREMRKAKRDFFPNTARLSTDFTRQSSIKPAEARVGNADR